MDSSASVDITSESLLSPANSNIPESTSISVQKLIAFRDTCATDAECAKILIDRYPAFATCKIDSLRSKITNTLSRVKDLKRSGSKKITDVLASIFEPIKPTMSRLSSTTSPRKRRIINKNESLKSEVRGLKRKNLELSSYVNALEKEQSNLMANYEQCLEALHTVQQEYSGLSERSDVFQLKTDLAKMERKYELAAERVDELGQKLITNQEKMAKYNTRNVSKREKRSKKKIADIKEKNDMLEDELKNFNAQVQIKDEEILTLASSLENIRRQLRNEKRRDRYKKSQDDKEMLKGEERDMKMEETLQAYKERITELEHKIMDTEIVRTFECGKYKTEIREVILTLINECDVSLRNVKPVISAVLKGLTGKIPERLPSLALLSRMSYEAKFIALRQVVSEILSKASLKDKNVLTLHSDGTTKKHRQFENYQCTLPDGTTLSMGLHEVSSQSADKNMAAFKDVVKQLAEARFSGNEENIRETEATILTSFQCTMSDQGPSNARFFHLLQQLREERLPEVVDSWEQLNDDERKEYSYMCNYYCKLHLLINFETAVSQTAQVFEKHVVSGTNPHSFATEPCGAKRLCKNASKALTMRGSDQSGVGGLWHTYLDGIGEDNYLINIAHDRLNTLFYQAAAVYHHQYHIVDFLSSLPDPNNLLRALQFDCQVKPYIAGVRALGILDKLVTGPYWRMLEAADNILSINDNLNLLRQKLESWGLNATPLMTEEIVLFPEVSIHKDVLYDALFKDTDDSDKDAYTQMCLELMCQTILLVLERQAKDQLTGGKFSDPSDHVKAISRAVPTTNMISERDFGQLDYLNKIKPSASITCYESIILWSNNKTSQWLQDLSATEKAELLNAAQQQGPSMYRKFQERKKILMEEKQAILREKQAMKEKKSENQVKKKADVTSELDKYGGLWRDPQTVTRNLEALTNKERVKALHAQISFHREVLKSLGKKELFQKSSKGKIYNVNILENNLLTIITTNNLEPPEDNTHLQYQPVERIRDFVANEKKVNLEKLIKQRIKIKIKEQKEKLEHFLADPSALVGMRVKHNIREKAGDDPQWLEACVTDITEASNDTIGTIYSIHYDDVPEEKNSFPLLKDMKNGDLLLI